MIGSGAREHAIAWKLAQSPRITRIFAAPGNAGTALLGANIPTATADFAGLYHAVKEQRIDLVIVGPEDPLAGGIVDYFEERLVPVFGPNARAAEIEASKTFAKGLLQRCGIPTAQSESFDSYDHARTYLRSLASPPVIKADGLAAGKGVSMPDTMDQAEAALKETMVSMAFGEAGRRVIIEERLTGVEASVFAFSDGKNVITTIPACDYKRAHDGDRGPNTGGMGSYSPPEFLDPAMVRHIHTTILQPTINAMAAEGRPFKGVLFAGLMINEGGCKVLEFNCRLGDPETQVILPRMRSDLLDVIEGVVQGTLDRVSIEWTDEACVGVALASGGYPGSYATGHPIEGLREIDDGVTVFHAGTRMDGATVVTNGGRVLTVSALGADLGKARDLAYENVRRIHFQDAQYREDIALRAVASA